MQTEASRAGERPFDAVVVGAGLNGAWAAKELAEGGLRVAIVDAGPTLPDALVRGEPDARDVFDPRYHLFRLQALLRGDRHRAFNKFIDEKTSALYLKRASDPYGTAPGRDFAWARVRAVGGRGHLWGRVMLRLEDDQLRREGCAWPISVAELRPYYDEVERALELGGAPSGHPGVADGVYVHARRLNDLEATFCDAVAARWPHRRAVVNHVAGYAPSPLSPMLEAALATGRAELRPGTVAASLLEGRGGEIQGVVAVDARSGRRTALRAGYVLLAASAFESTRLLLNSASDAHPGGVGNGSGLLGTRILEHVMVSIFDKLPPSAMSEAPRYRHNPFFLNEPPHGFYLPSFVQAEEPEHGAFGYGVQGVISPDTGIYYVGAFGETRPRDENRLRTEPGTTDRHGIPIATIDFSWSAEDLALFERARRAVAEMTAEFEAAARLRLRHPVATRVYRKLVSERPTPGSNHECGGARMGDDPATSVVDPLGRVWDAPNVVVCDTAVFPSIPQQNPTLTSMALAVRAARALAGSTRAGAC